MAVKQVTVNVAKELDDVLALVVDVVKQVKAGKSALELAALELPALVSAINGLDQIPAELADLQSVIAGVGVRTGELVAALVVKKA